MREVFVESLSVTRFSEVPKLVGIYSIAWILNNPRSSGTGVGGFFAASPNAYASLRSERKLPCGRCIHAHPACAFLPGFHAQELRQPDEGRHEFLELLG